MLSCKEAAHLLSRAEEAPLTLRQRWTLGFHLSMCGMCRNFKRQLRFLRRAMQRYEG